MRPIGDSRRQARGLKRRSHGPVRRARGPRAASCRACRDPSESRPPGTTCVTTGDLVARPFIENRRPRPRLNERSWCTGVSRPRCRDHSKGAARCSRPPTDLLLSATWLHRRRPRGAQDLRHNCTYSTRDEAIGRVRLLPLYLQDRRTLRSLFFRSPTVSRRRPPSHVTLARGVSGTCVTTAPTRCCYAVACTTTPRSVLTIRAGVRRFQVGKRRSIANKSRI